MKAGKRILAGVFTSVMAITLLAGMPMGKNGEVSAARRTLKEPSVNEKGIVTWDCICFGNYPQSDATGKTKDPIKWRVLSVKGNDAFLIADQNLDAKRYNEDQEAVTWETCTIRSWLNGYGNNSNVCQIDYSSDNFVDCAFTASEQAAIKITKVENADNPKYNTSGGEDTKDKIFLLSNADVKNPDYGFFSDSRDNNAGRMRTNTAYVAERIQRLSPDNSTGIGGENLVYYWWLRSPGWNPIYAAMMDWLGKVADSGDIVNNTCAVCPALHLDLSCTDVWFYAGTVISSGGGFRCPHENIELEGKREACAKAGYTGDTYCADCGVRLKDGETIPARGGHQWDSGRITKRATEKEDAIKTFTCTVCGETRTEPIRGTAQKEQPDRDLIDIPKEVQEVTDTSIARQPSEDMKGAVFNALAARTTKLTNKTITLKWKKILKADGYKIYGNQCGKKNHYKLLKDVGKNKTAYTQKKLKKGTYYKYVVTAYKVVNGKKVTIAVSKTIHAATAGGKYGVAKAVKVNKSRITLKKGKTFTIRAKEVKKDKKIKNHRKIAYESGNTKVATVSKKGVVKAKKKGNCYIYVYAQNGVYKRVKVDVK